MRSGSNYRQIYLQRPDWLAGGGITNTFGYAGESPVMGVDPLGLRWIIAAGWERDIPKMSVGHVVLAETNGKVLLSQFPDTPLWPWGKNTPESWDDTMKSEDNRNPSKVYKVWISDDKAFDDAIAVQKARHTWKAFPMTKDSTNCTVSVYSALLNGGVPLPLPNWYPATPNNFIDAMDLLSSDPKKYPVYTLPAVPWKTSHFTSQKP